MTTINQKLKVATMTFFVVMVSIGVTAKQKDKAYDIEGALCELDEAVAHYSDFERIRIAEIERKKQELRHATFDSDRYLVMTQIFDQYKKINSDSALNYANRCITLAERCYRDDWHKEALLNRAKIYTYRGNLMLARQDLTTIGNIDFLPHPLQQKVASVLCSFYRAFMSNDMFRKSKLHADALKSMNINWQAVPDLYLKDSPIAYFRAKSYVGLDCRSDFDKIKAIYEKEVNKPGINNLGYILAQLYLAKGDTAAYKYYLVKTVNNHIRNVYKCADAMLELLSTDWLLENPERAYNYVTLYSSDISYFQDTRRSSKLVAIQNKIVQRFIEKQNRLRTSLIVVVGVLLVMFAYSVVLMVKLRHRMRKIDELNGRVERRNKTLANTIKEVEHMSAELKTSNERLQDELKLRDGNFMDTYLMCSDYIKMHRNFRNTIANLLKTNSVKQAIKQLSSREATDAELKEFYKKFDRAFQSTHPDFIERFNRILRPDSQYTLNEEKELSPELRIYALISLGINNSVNIAEFLHYSVQTIYNYRLRMRRQACIPESVFAEAVGHLYEDDKLKHYLTMGV